VIFGVLKKFEEEVFAEQQVLEVVILMDSSMIPNSIPHEQFEASHWVDAS
jgi:hypothetical protein